MYNPTTRLLTILELLQTYRSLGGDELARRLEVEPRSVRRYILMLQDMGIPIEATRGPGGGYQLRPGYKLPPLMFSEAEATAIVLGLLGSTRLDLGQSSVAIEGALAKVMRVLPHRARERLDAVSSHMLVSSEAESPRPDAVLLLDISEATQLARRMLMRYRTTGNSVSERPIEPYGVALWWGNWYLAAWCCLRHDWRTFRLTRIESITMLDETFTRDTTFDMATYIAETLGHIGDRWPLEVVFHAPLQLVQPKLPSYYGTLTATDEGVVFEGAHGDLRDVARFLVGLSLPFSVREPAELRDELRRIAEEITHYADS